MAGAVHGLDLLQQRGGAWTDNAAQVIFGGGLKKETVKGGLPLSVAIEPGALTGDMVQNQIRHQMKIFADAVDVRPVSQLRVYRPEIRNRKAVVRGEGKEGQNMHAIDQAFHAPQQKVMHQIQWFVSAVQDRVSIGYQQRVPFGP